MALSSKRSRKKQISGLHKCEPPHLLPLMIPIPSKVWYPCVLKGGSVWLMLHILLR